MDSQKEQYLAFVRANSAYPIYRGVINIIAMLFYLLAGVCALGALMGGVTVMSRSFISGVGLSVIGLIFAAIYFFAARLFKEASLILVDMGDSIIDANSRPVH